MNEEWRPIVGYEGWYEVSSFGRVRRIRHGAGTWCGRILSGHRCGRHGYNAVVLTIRGESTNVHTHRLVAEAFYGSIRDGYCVNHLNGVKSDNRVWNLEVCTPAQNCRHAFVAGLTTQPRLSAKDILEIRMKYRNRGKTMRSLATLYGVSRQTICNCIHRSTLGYR